MAKRKRSKKTTPSEVAPEVPLSAPVEESVPDTVAVTVPAPDSQENLDVQADQTAPDDTEPTAPESTPDGSDPGSAAAEATPTDAMPDVAAAPVETDDAEPTAQAAGEVDAEAWPEATPAPEGATEAWAWPEGNVEEAATPEQAAEGAADTGEGQPVPEGARLAAIVESLLFASDKPLSLSDLRRLLGIRDGKKITAALEELTEQRMGTGIEVATLSNGWMLRTNPENAPWVSRLLVGKPMRLSRAMLETLAIVAYRQPVTRPEIDDIRGVDCGPVLKTLLDRGLVRIIGKKEEVGRPLLYGTTPEFLRVFNLRELAELPTLREFYDLSAEDQSRVDAEHGLEKDNPPSATSPKPEVALGSVSRGELPPEPEEADPLIDELDNASQMAKKALGNLEPRASETPEADKDVAEPAAQPGPATPSGE